MSNRILKESICTSDNIAALSLAAERFWYRLIVQADDYGRYDGRASIIRARCFPLVLAGVSERNVKAWLEELVGLGMVVLYEAGGKSYLHLPAWETHQRVRARVSKFPPPPSDDSKSLTPDSKSPPKTAVILNPESRILNPENDSCTEPGTAPASVPAILKGLKLYEKDEKLCKRLPKVLDAWKKAYPGVDIAAEIAKAHAWELSNPKHIKKDRIRFLANWLNRAQDESTRKGRDHGSQQTGTLGPGAQAGGGRDRGEYDGIGADVENEETSVATG